MTITGELFILLQSCLYNYRSEQIIVGKCLLGMNTGRCNADD